MQDYRMEYEKEQERKRSRRAMCIIGLILALFVFLIVDAVFCGIILVKGVKEGKYPVLSEVLQELLELAQMEDSEEELRKPDISEELGTGYDGIWAVWENSTNCIAQKDGKWGVITMEGEEVVPFEYDRFSYADKTGWVEFEKNGLYFVYDKDGDLIKTYENKLTFREGNESEELYRTAVAFMSGMRVRTTIPEISGTDFYGIRYENAISGELLYEAVGDYSEAGIFSFPDADGYAVAIKGDGVTNTLYKISETGCESVEMELPEGVYYRYFDFPGDYQWADINFSNGWLRVYVYDEIEGFLLPEEDIYMASLNVDTMELIRFPEEYQDFRMMYDGGYGEWMALANEQENTDLYKYAICKGDRVLTEEKYHRIVWGERYIIGVTEEQTEVLNYEGTVLATYPMTGEKFVNGRLLVYDGTGVYYVDETLQKCSEYLVTGEIEDCFSVGVIVDGMWYLLEEPQKEKAAETAPAGAEPLSRSGIPEGLELEYVRDADRTDYINSSLYAMQYGEKFKLVNFDGESVADTLFRYYYHYDDEWACVMDEDYGGYVFDTSGNLLYEHNYVENGLITKDGIEYQKYIQYSEGMRIEQDIATGDGEYYGVHYYNAESGKLIFEAVGTYEDIAVNSLPDETGTAVVIVCDASESHFYKITKDGYTEETYAVSNMEARDFYYSDFIDWRQSAMSEGWLKTLVAEYRGELLNYSEEWKEVLYNIHTHEMVSVPEKYQDYSDYYTKSAKGLYYGITRMTEEEYFEGTTENLYYAICCGNKILTDEIYSWIYFDENYILAGNDWYAHILDYEGKVLAEYRDVGTCFRNGRLLVYDGKGVYFIEEETLSACTGYIKRISNAYCEQRSFWDDHGVYMIIWEEEEDASCGD